MSRRISLVEKRHWLQDHEAGQSEYTLKKKYKKDIRTIKHGIEAARLDRDVSSARVAMMKDVLLKHQGRLLEKLQALRSSIAAPGYDHSPLSWHQREESVFSSRSIPSPAQAPEDPVMKMLQQHLAGDRLWKQAEEYRSRYQANMAAREELQRCIFRVLKGLGYPVVDGAHSRPPCLYADTAGALFYRSVLASALSLGNAVDVPREINTVSDQRTVVHRHFILSEGADDLEAVKRKLIRTYRRVSRLEEVSRVAETQKALETAVAKLQETVDGIVLMDYVPGECQVCRRMSRP